MRISSKLLAVLIFGAALIAFADESRETTARLALAGSSGKSWVRIAMRIFLGPEKKCAQGETWFFRPDGGVRIDRCIEGKLVTENAAWHLHAIDALDVGVSIEDRDYVLLLPELGNGKKTGTMVLRRRFDAKGIPSENIEFTYEKE